MFKQFDKNCSGKNRKCFDLKQNKLKNKIRKKALFGSII